MTRTLSLKWREQGDVFSVNTNSAHKHFPRPRWHLPLCVQQQTSLLAKPTEASGFPHPRSKSPPDQRCRPRVPAGSSTSTSDAAQHPSFHFTNEETEINREEVALQVTEFTWEGRGSERPPAVAGTHLVSSDTDEGSGEAPAPVPTSETLRLDPGRS